jgi:hypothetical protein
MQDRYMSGLVDTISAIHDPGGVTAIFPPDIPGWRHLSYYMPSAHVLAIGPVNQGSRTVIRIYQKGGQTSASSSDVFRIPSCGVIALVEPVNSPVEADGKPVPIARSGNLWSLHAAPGLSFRSRGLRFVTEDAPCQSGPAARAIM